MKNNFLPKIFIVLLAIVHCLAIFSPSLKSALTVLSVENLSNDHLLKVAVPVYNMLCYPSHGQDEETL